MTRVAGILVNIIAYHHARWEAFARHAGAECEVVELTKRDAFRVLEFSGITRYGRKTLFSNDTNEAISGRVLNRAMTATLDQFRPAVVCISGYAFPVSLAALQWAVRRRVPAVVLSESNEFDHQRSAAKEFIKRRVVGLCSAGLAGGTPQAAYLTKLGLPGDHVFVGYDVVDNGYFSTKVGEIRTQRAEITERLRLPEHYFLACCRFGKKKNVPRLIEAYALYRAFCEKSTARSQSSSGPVPPWSLVIAGDGEERPEIQETVSRLRMGGSVHLVGAKSYADIPTCYALATAFVHASTTEPWGLVVNEAMASGLPVLVSNRCGCASDLVHEGVNGFTFDPCDTDQLAQLMFKISALQPSSLSAFGDASRRIIADWGPDRFAAGLEAAVGKAIKVGAKPATAADRVLLAVLGARWSRDT